MPELGERLDGVERRLGGVERRLDGVERRLEKVETGVSDLRKDVNGLRILDEKHAEDIKKIAEVQSHHGAKLEEIAKALAPLSDMQDFIRRIAPDHEHRIQALEKHTGISH